jgi:hypothetical protein
MSRKIASPLSRAVVVLIFGTLEMERFDRLAFGAKKHPSSHLALKAF